MLLNEYIIFCAYFNFWQYFVEILIDNFPDDSRWHATEPRVCLSQFSAHSQLFPTSFYTHSLYVTVLNWLFVQNILKLVKINPSQTKTWPLAPDIFTIFDQTLKTSQLQNQFIFWNLNFGGDKISSDWAGFWKILWLHYILDCADWVMSSGCHMLPIAELSVSRSWEINNFYTFENLFLVMFVLEP